MRIDVYRKGERWFIRLIARNGRVVIDTAKAGDGYRRKKAAVDVATTIAHDRLILSIED
jgi:uncharacterized protein YegP (UPF0339 family)